MENTDTISSTILLNNGIHMPRVGLGTHAIKNIEEVVYQSIKDGVRLIDTAAIYKNEKQVGIGIKKAIDEGVVKREELFVVTKLWVDSRHEPEDAIKRSLKELDLTYVDLYLDHWPVSEYYRDGELKKVSVRDLWRNMEELVRKGYTKSIGVSNYNVQLLSDLLTYAEIPPVTNQVEIHPYLTQKNLIKYCHDKKVYITAYNSLMKGVYVHKLNQTQLDLLSEPIIKSLAEKHKKGEGLIALNWAIIQDMIVIPATANPNRMKENIQATSFKLSQDEVKLIDTLNLNNRFNRSDAEAYRYFTNGVDIWA